MTNVQHSYMNIDKICEHHQMNNFIGWYHPPFIQGGGIKRALPGICPLLMAFLVIHSDKFQ